MEIKHVTTPEELARCYPVMAQLRPHLSEAEFIAAAQRQFSEGYRLLALTDDGAVRALAGYRVMEMLAYGRSLYVDDLVTDNTQRSHGYGKALLDWLNEYARSQQCVRLHLDSGVQRFDAHRFYFRERMHISAYHFSLQLES
jgi:GNAT superfamily N-acetyltransferase